MREAKREGAEGILMLTEATAAKDCLSKVKHAPAVIALGWVAGGLTQLISLQLLVENLCSDCP